MADKIYARLVNGAVAEYPVFAEHIVNRAHPFDWYTEVQFDTVPTVPDYFSLSETLTVKNGVVTASYSVYPLSLDQILSDLYKGDPTATAIPGTPVEVTFASIPAPTVKRITELASDQVQAMLDAFAQTHNFDGILSATSYAGSGNPLFAADGQKAVIQRDAIWAELYTYLAKVEAGTLPVPKSFADVQAELTPLAW